MRCMGFCISTAARLDTSLTGNIYDKRSIFEYSEFQQSKARYMVPVFTGGQKTPMYTSEHGLSIRAVFTGARYTLPVFMCQSVVTVKSVSGPWVQLPTERDRKAPLPNFSTHCSGTVAHISATAELLYNSDVLVTSPCLLWFLANVRYIMLSPVRLTSVVCNVRAPYSGGSNFRQYFYGIRYLGHPLTSTENFTEFVPGEPLRRGS